MTKLTIRTSKGPVHAEITRDNGVLQFHAFHAPGGIGFFIVFPESMEDKVEDAVRTLVGGHDLDPDTNIASLIPGCLAAGTGPRHKFSATFGTPEVHHAA